MSGVTDTLSKIQERGYLKCGIRSATRGLALDGTGFEIDLCRAMAASIFHGVPRVQYVDGASTLSESTDANQDDNVRLSLFTDLDQQRVDLVAGGIVHTMEREIFYAPTQTGYAFSIPYLYTGLQLAGLASAVSCLEQQVARTKNNDDMTMMSISRTTSDGLDDANGTTATLNENNTEDACSTTPMIQICTVTDSSHLYVLQDLFPERGLVLAESAEEARWKFQQGFCNVVAGNSFRVASNLLQDNSDANSARVNDTSPPQIVGSLLLSKEPLALATRRDDVAWSDRVNWILQALLTAEEEGVNMANARTQLALSPLYGTAFQDAVAAVGNYGELYERHLQTIVPRMQVNKVNRGMSGRLYSTPFGALNINGLDHGKNSSPLLQQVQQRGVLRCGIHNNAGFAELHDQGVWRGFDIDYCRAIAAAIFSGDSSKVVFINFPFSERFKALQSRQVDVLVAATTVNFARDVRETTTNHGFSFSQPIFYDGMTFGGIPEFLECAERLDASSTETCRNLKICVEKGSTFEERLPKLFKSNTVNNSTLPIIVSSPTYDFVLSNFQSSQCNVISGGFLDVREQPIRNLGGYTGPYSISSSLFSKDPLAVVTREDDILWTAFVNWIVEGTIYAAEQGITQATSNRMPVVFLFGPLFTRIWRNSIRAVGNHGEIFDRNMRQLVEQSGLNLINNGNPLGPQHYPYPGVVTND